MRLLLFCIFAIMLCCSCKKETISGGKVMEIYLLKIRKNIAGKCQIDPAASVIRDTATISDQDILEYSPATYELKLSDIAYQKVKKISDGTAFAVTVDRQVIYYGFYKPSISSGSCEHSITMNIAFSSESKIVFNLGYPDRSNNTTIDDQRNNAKLLATLKLQGKIR